MVMSAALDLDIAALVGEMEAPPCEHPEHGMPRKAHSDGPATHYAQSHCPDCDYSPPLRSVCAAYVHFVVSDGHMYCSGCGTRGGAWEFVTILGPVSS